MLTLEVDEAADPSFDDLSYALDAVELVVVSNMAELYSRPANHAREDLLHNAVSGRMDTLYHLLLCVHSAVARRYHEALSARDADSAWDALLELRRLRCHPAQTSLPEPLRAYWEREFIRQPDPGSWMKPRPIPPLPLGRAVEQPAPREVRG